MTQRPSRRKQKHEAKLHQVRSRNLIAGVLLLFAIVAGGWYIYTLIPPRTPKLSVSINFVNYGSVEELNLSSRHVYHTQFARESATRIGDSIKNRAKTDFTESNFTFHESQGRSNILELPDSRDGVLLVYLQGQIEVREHQNKSQLCLISSEQSAESVQPLKVVFKTLATRTNQSKLILFDMGDRGWSPIFPGRKSQKFESEFQRVFENDEWGLGENTWIILSHSDSEISLVSTVFKSTLFALAISETLENWSGKSVTIQPFFNEIFGRTIAYSKNFNDESLQHPILFKVGETEALPITEVVETPRLINSTDNPQFLFSTKEPEPAEKKNDAEEKTESTALVLRDFEAGNSDFFEWVEKTAGSSEPENLAICVAPKKTLRHAEYYMNFGRGGDPTDGSNGIQPHEFNGYAEQWKAQEENEVETNFDSAKFKQSKESMAYISKELLKKQIELRFLNFLHVWDDDAFEKSRKCVDGFATTESAIELIEKKVANLTENELSPLQAELIGVVSGRLIPLLKKIDPQNKGTSKDQPPVDTSIAAGGEFTVSLEFDDLSKNSDAKFSIAKCLSEPPKKHEFSNSTYDLPNNLKIQELVVEGTDGADELLGAAPKFDWSPRIARMEWSNQSSRLIINPDYTSNNLEIETEGLKDKFVELRFTGEDADELKDFLQLSHVESWDPAGKHRIPIGGKTERGVTTSKVYLNSQIEGSIKYFQDLDVGLQLVFTGSPFAMNTKFTRAFDLQPKFSKDYSIEISSQRELVSEGGTSKVALIKWPPVPMEKDIEAWQNWKPLGLLTFPNIKSEFSFQLKNNSNKAKNYRVELRAIAELPAGMNNDLYPDAISSDSASEYSGWLLSEFELTKNKEQFWSNANLFALVGTADATVQAGQTEAILLKKPPPEPDEETTDTDLVGNGLLLLVWDLKEGVAVAKPNYLQFVEFQIDEPLNTDEIRIADNEWSIQSAAISKFKSKAAKEMLVKNAVDPKVLMTSLTSKQGNQTRTERLKIENIIDSGSTFSVPQGELAVSVASYLGIPGVASFRTEKNGRTIILDPRFQISGLRFKKLPEGWEVFPQSEDPGSLWSLSSTKLDLSPIVKPQQDIFIKATGRGEIVLEFLFPHEEGPWRKLRSGSELDSHERYTYEWKGENSFRHPTKRKPVLQFNEAGNLEAWTELSCNSTGVPIELTKTEFENSSSVVLKSNDEKIGHWIFRTESIGVPTLRLANENGLNILRSQLTGVQVELALPIRPPISPANVTLKYGAGDDAPSLSADACAAFLNNHRTEQGYEFALNSLLEAMEVDSANIQPGKLRVSVVDFFESEKSASSERLTFRAPKKRPGDGNPPKPVPRPLAEDKPVIISFAFPEEIPAESVSEIAITKVRINSTNIGGSEAGSPNFGNRFKLGGSRNVAVTRLNLTEDISKQDGVKVKQLIIGSEYSISVFANVKHDGNTQQMVARLPSTTITAENRTFTLTFE